MNKENCALKLVDEISLKTLSISVQIFSISVRSLLDLRVSRLGSLVLLIIVVFKVTMTM